MIPNSSHLNDCFALNPAHRRIYATLAMPLLRLIIPGDDNWQAASTGECNGFALSTDDLDQHHVACLTFNESCNLTAAIFAQQIAVPVPWYGPILCCGRALADRYRVRNSAAIV